MRSFMCDTPAVCEPVMREHCSFILMFSSGLCLRKKKRCKLNIEIPLLPATYEVMWYQSPSSPLRAFWHFCQPELMRKMWPCIHLCKTQNTYLMIQIMQFEIFNIYVIQYRWCSIFNQTQPTGINLYLFMFCKNIFPIRIVRIFFF